MPRPESRTARWSRNAAAAVEALTELQELQQEYQDWLDNLPENLQGGTLAEKLETVTELAVEEALEIANEAEGIDLPLGFGRD